MLVLLCTLRWHFADTLSWTSVDPVFFSGEPSLCVTGFSAETAGLPVIKPQRVGPRKTSCPESVAILNIAMVIYFVLRKRTKVFCQVLVLFLSNFNDNPVSKPCIKNPARQ